MPTNLSLDQIYQLINEASQLDRFFALQLFFIIFTGCTVEESCVITWEGLYIHEQEMRICKKTYPLNNDALQILSGCSRVFDPYVFGYRHPSQIHNRTRILAGRLKDQFTVSELRKAYAAAMWWRDIQGVTLDIGMHRER